MSGVITTKLLMVGVDSLIGAVGFGLSVAWGTVSGRDMDRDTKLFLGKMWMGIALFGIVMLFVL